jgi:hypothetical protein
LDVDALGSAIGGVLGDFGAARARAAAARQRIERELSFAQRTRRLEEIYIGLASSELRGLPRGGAVANASDEQPTGTSNA